MANNKVLLPWTTLLTNSTSEEFWPATPWMSSQGLLRLRAQFEVRSLGANVQVAPAYQRAEVPSLPSGEGAGINPGAQSAEGCFYPNDYTDPTSGSDDTDTMPLIRFGWRVNLSTGSTLAHARVGGVVEIVTE